MFRNFNRKQVFNKILLDFNFSTDVVKLYDNCEKAF